MGEIVLTHRSDQGSRPVADENHHCHLKSNCITIVIVCLRLAVSSLMMEGYSGVISRSGRARSTRKAVVVRPVHARTATEILHLWLRAGAACEISIAANRCQVRRRSREVVLEATVTECSCTLARSGVVSRGGVE